jgi:hypothetical protein
MIAFLLSELASSVSGVAVAAADGDGGATPWLLALGPAGGGAVYFGLWRYYRNTHQSHSFETETRIGAQPVTGNDVKVQEITGTKKTGIDGDNRTNHRKRVQRFDAG